MIIFGIWDLVFVVGNFLHHHKHQNYHHHYHSHHSDFCQYHQITHFEVFVKMMVQGGSIRISFPSSFSSISQLVEGKNGGCSMAGSVG